MLQIQNDSVVSLQYVLKNSKGETLDQSSTNDPLVYLHGGENIVPGLEKELTGLKVGDKKSVTVSAKDGYGEYRPEMCLDVKRTQFPKDAELKEGMQFQANSPEGFPMLFTIKQVGFENVKVDGNHPLAGVDLHFSVEIVNIRMATEEEKSHGHVHGEGGHHH